MTHRALLDDGRHQSSGLRAAILEQQPRTRKPLQLAQPTGPVNTSQKRSPHSMRSTKKVLIGLGAGASVAAIVIAGPAGVASAKSLITGTDIKNGTIHRGDLAPALVSKLKGQK